MKTKLIAAAVTMTLAIAICAPQPAQAAGGKKTAAAFAGLAAAAAWWHHHRAEEARESACTPPVQYTPRPGYRRPGTITHRMQVSPQRRHFRPTCRPQGPIVHHVSPTRRLYQPRVHGHPAFVQQWSHRRGCWVTISRHPSVW